MLFQQLVKRCLFNRLVASLLKDVTMLLVFQQLVNKMSPQQACRKLVKRCDNAVPTTCQQGFSQQVCSKLVNKLWQCCSNNLSTRCLLNSLVASLLTSCDNAVPTVRQQDFSQQVCSKFVNKLWQCCPINLSTRCLLDSLVASLLTSCENAVPTIRQQDFSQQVCSKLVNKLWQCCSNNLSTRFFATRL
jgi:hypothetical protein